MSAEAQRHPREKSYICPLCGKSFHRKDYLIVHYRNHKGEMPCVCDKCGKRFVTKGHLTKHLVSHNENKPFACDICDKRFARKGDVTRHLKARPSLTSVIATDITRKSIIGSKLCMETL
ncbi:Asparagine-rich zinc finger protein AZF1 [Araneus ventricosus]|uniref:Asparagine-rich zinc finger protein AZF1 n=1 Tax=Araneus ventricosus TaxID=182803 RepID=A0A4Y2MVF0_ARAVE|nr:Asparagine-rich zinc finger protein AZF1 [Araneus ventricosus]